MSDRPPRPASEADLLRWAETLAGIAQTGLGFTDSLYERERRQKRDDGLSASYVTLQETGHWYVPPGRHVYRYKVKNIANSVLFDTRAHYIGAHLHPFGESLELLDLTTGESVFKSVAENLPDRIALDYITHYSSVEGIPIDPDHEYELVAVYNNTTGGDVDSMAVMYMYLEDTNRPRPAKSQG